MARFIATLFFFLGLCILLLGCLGSFSTPHHPNPLYLHKTVYLSPNLSPTEKSLVIAAIRTWECSTKHLIDYRILSNPTQSDIDALNNNPSILIIKNTNLFDPVVESSDAEQPPPLRTVSLYHINQNKVPEIEMVEVLIDNPSTYYSLLLHELFHSLGADHSSDTDSIMYPRIDKSSQTITNTDLGQFCMLYNCNAAELKVCQDYLPTIL